MVKIDSKNCRRCQHVMLEHFEIFTDTVPIECPEHGLIPVFRGFQKTECRNCQVCHDGYKEVAHMFCDQCKGTNLVPDSADTSDSLLCFTLNPQNGS